MCQASLRAGIGTGRATDAIERIGDAHHLGGVLVIVVLLAFDQLEDIARARLVTAAAADAAALVQGGDECGHPLAPTARSSVARGGNHRPHPPFLAAFNALAASFQAWQALKVPSAISWISPNPSGSRSSARSCMRPAHSATTRLRFITSFSSVCTCSSLMAVLLGFSGSQRSRLRHFVVFLHEGRRFRDDLAGFLFQFLERGEAETVDVTQRPVENDKFADGDERPAEALVCQ